ncbi:NAD-dependent epimerase/dehydratase family protein [Stenotrophomonas sp. SY1]|uniref:NAD-dependent epimerase/dehydratase family protein n=1 Tax=Stenotrophomonas sp. SY1 TaxID=477235 RepID=UPI001E44FFBF|nr:NAD-dependent epimerase/dehydratase family protein [Stenotrophomonas sp. SY1]MCD9085892.1 NAD-dependent epimerase/dehydratase family protein [Stenotrophomonas sp. SY1]
MIVGSGLIARAFQGFADDQDTIIFASGVSNSGERDPIAFSRERELLHHFLEQTSGRLVYFGSCNVVNPDQNSPYFDHKRAMEQLVISSGKGLVLRLPQVVGHTRNPNTLTNYLRDCIVQSRPLTLWTHAQRNLIDIDDVASIATNLLSSADTPSLVSIASPWSLAMPHLVSLFEQVLGRKAIVELIECGEHMNIDSALAEAVARDIGLDFGPDYPLRVIQKYYGSPHEA